MESPKAAQSRFSSQQFLFLLSSFTGISSFRVQIRLVYKVVREWRRYSIDVTSEGGSRERKFSRNFVIAVGRTGFSDCANRCLPAWIYSSYVSRSLFFPWLVLVVDEFSFWRGDDEPWCARVPIHTHGRLSPCIRLHEGSAIIVSWQMEGLCVPKQP